VNILLALLDGVATLRFILQDGLVDPERFEEEFSDNRKAIDRAIGEIKDLLGRLRERHS
jgi:hypothetical protein